METITETAAVLNELIAIHNDRIRGYENATEETANPELKEIFAEMIKASVLFRDALALEVKNYGQEIEYGTTFMGKLYRAWTDVKIVFTGKDEYEILSNCEFGEDAMQKAYKDALDADDLPLAIRNILYEQQQFLKLSHDKIKMLRDSYK